MCGEPPPDLRRAGANGPTGSPTTSPASGSATATTSASTRRTAPSGSRGCSACFKIRAVPINVNFRYVEDELRYLFDNADLVGVLYDPEYADRLDAIAGELPRLPSRLAVGDEYEAALAAASPDRDFDARSGDDLYILYTGGTTGMPKGVMWRQEDVFFALGQGIDATTGHKVDSDDELAKKGASGVARSCCSSRRR